MASTAPYWNPAGGQQLSDVSVGCLRPVLTCVDLCLCLVVVGVLDVGVLGVGVESSIFCKNVFYNGFMIHKLD